MAFTDALVDHADGHVTLVDRRHAAGGHWLDAADGVHDVDTGFIVFNEERYPCFVRLLEKPSSMSFSVHSEVDGLEYSNRSLSSTRTTGACAGGSLRT